MNGTHIGVDLAKSVFEVAVSRSPGRVHERHRLSRNRFQRFFAQHRPAEVLMEACGSAHPCVMRSLSSSQLFGLSHEKGAWRPR